MITSGLQQAAIFADHQFDLVSLGKPGERMGDFNADGLTDLIFHRYDSTLEATIITIIFGGEVLPRLITADSLDPVYSRQIVLTDAELRNFSDEDARTGALEIQVMAARWSGHYNAQAGHYYDDLLVVSPLPNSINDYGYIFAGDVIRSQAIGVPLASADALVNLNLFTTTVSSGPIETPFPQRDLYGNETRMFMPVYTTGSGTGTVADATAGAANIDGVSSVGTGVIVFDGASVQNSDDYISSVTLTGNSSGGANVSVNWYFSGSGSYSLSFGVNIKVWVGGPNGWTQVASQDFTTGNATINSFNTYNSLTLTSAQLALGDFVRVGLQDRANSTDTINGFYASAPSGNHFDNVDTAVPTSGAQAGSNTTDYAINDYQTTSSTINLSGTAPTTAIRVTIDELFHTYVGDLVISLRSPDGFTQVLRNRVGGGADNITGESFLITSGSLIGGSSGGNWTLLVEDRAGLDQGYLSKWSIEVEAASSTVATSGPTDLDLEVSGISGNLTDVDVIINELTTGSLAGLKVELVAPDNTSTLLFDGIGGSSTTMMNSIFSQESGRAINTGTGLFNDVFRPQGNLSSFALKGGRILNPLDPLDPLNPLDPNGTWSLRITDNTIDGVATEVDWSLRIRTDEWAASTITVSDKGKTSDVVLNVQFSHASGNDLNFRLTGPAGQEVNLPDLASWNNVTFDDDGVDGTLLLALDNFRDTNADGTWTLEVQDTVGNWDGVLRNWSLDIASQLTEVALNVANQPEGATDVTLDVRLLPNAADGRPLDLSGIGLTLVTPDNREIILFNPGTLTGTALGGALRAIRFSDTAQNAVTSGSAPYAGIYSPLELLNLLDGDDNVIPFNPNGEWALQIFDRDGDLAGIVESWDLNFSYEPIDGQAMRASVVGDVNGDGLDDIGFVVDGFRGEESNDPAVGRAYILGGRDLPNNSGTGAILASVEGLTDGDTIANALTSGGTANSRAAVILEIDGVSNNLLFRALNNGTSENGVAIRVLYAPNQDEGVETSYDIANKVLTISIRGLGVNSNDVITRIQSSEASGMDAFRAIFAVSLYAETQANLYTESIWQVFGTNIDGSIQPLGDLNNDGADDFALTRSREDSANASGAVLVYTGSTDWRLPQTTSTDASLSTFLQIKQASAGQFGSTSIFSDLQVTAGDFNGDGQIDLVVGRPEFTRVSGQLDTYSAAQVLTNSTRGAVYTFFSITNRTSDLLLSDAHIVIEGQGETDRLGTLPWSPFMDVNADGINDLFIGAPTANSSLGGVRVGAGRLYLIYGSRTIEALPTTDFDILTNRSVAGAGSFLVDTGIGRPSVFFDADLTGDGVLDSDRYTLQPGEGEKWYRFTTLGDGALGDMIRLDPIAGTQTEQTITGLSGVLTQTGTDEYSVDLSGLGMTLINLTDQAILEFDLTAYLGQLDNPEILKRVTLRLAGLSSSDISLPDGVTLMSALGSTELAFTLRTADNRFELWRSDGTPFGSQRIAILNNEPVALHAVGSQLFIVQYSADADRYNVWSLNAARTGLVLESGIGQLTEEPTQFAGRDGRYYVAASGTVYSGTTPNSAVAISGPTGVTRLIQTSDTEVYAMSGANLWSLSNASASVVERSSDVLGTSNLEAAGDWVFYRDLFEGVNVVWFARLGGSSPSADAVPLTNSGGGSMLSISEAVAIGDHVYLIGAATNGSGLWYLAPDSDELVAVGSSLANPADLLALSGDRLAFNYGASFARNGLAVVDVDADPDAIAANATMADDTGNITTLYAYDNVLEETGTTFFFGAENASGVEVAWEATINGSSLDFAQFSTASSAPTNPTEFISFAGEIYFAGTTSLFGREIYSYDGTNIALAADIRAGVANSNPAELTVVGSQLNFTAVAPDTLVREIFTISTSTSGLILDAPGTNNALNFSAPDTVSTPSVSITPIELIGTMVGGSGSARATTTINFAGETLRVRSSSNGSALNDTLVTLIGSSTAGVSVDYDSTAKTLVVTYQYDVSTLGAIATEIAKESGITANASSNSTVVTSITTQTVGDELIIRVTPGITTAANIVTYFSTGNPGTGTNWTASLVTSDSEGTGNDGSGILLAGEYVVTGGTLAVDNTRTLNLPGTTATLTLGERPSGTSLTDLTVVWATGSSTSAAYNSSTNTLTLTYQSGTTTVNALSAAIGEVGAEVAGIPFRSTVVGTGTNTISSLSGTFSVGVDEVNATATLTIGVGTINITAATAGTSLNDYIFRVVGANTDGDGSALSAGTPVAIEFDNANDTYTIYALPGEASLANIAAIINGLTNFTATVDSTMTDAQLEAVLDLGGTMVSDNTSGTRTVTFNGAQFTVVSGDKYTITIGSDSFAVTAASADLDDFVSALASAINGHTDYGATSSTNVLSITGAPTDTITLREWEDTTADVTIDASTADQLSLQFSGFTVVSGREYTISIDGDEFTATATSTTLTALLQLLATEIAADAAYGAGHPSTRIEITGTGVDGAIVVFYEKVPVSTGVTVALIEDSTLALSIAGETLTISGGNDEIGDTVVFDGSGSATASASYSSGVLTVVYRLGVSDLAEIVSAINGVTEFSASSTDGTAVVVAVATTTTANGVNPVAAVATVTLPDGTVLTLTSDDATTHASFSAKTVNVVTGASVGAASASAVTITLVDGTTTLAALNTELGTESIDLTASRSSGSGALITYLTNYTAGSAAIPATAQVRAPGGNNDFTIQASPRIENYAVRFVDGGPGSDVSVRIVDGAIVISIDFGTSTSKNVVDALNTPFTFTTTFDGGASGAKASGSITILESTININVSNNGASYNGVNIIMVGDDMATDISAVWVGDDVAGTANRTLTLTYIPDVSTLGEIVAFLNSYSGAGIGSGPTAFDFEASVATGGNSADVILSLGATFLTETGASAVHTGSGVINPAPVSAGELPTVADDNLFNPRELTVIDGILYLVGDYFQALTGTLDNGGASAAARVTLMLGGESLTIYGSTDGSTSANGTSFDDIDVSISANSEDGVSVSYDSVNGTLSVSYQPGDSTYQDLKDAIDALPNFSITYVTANLGETLLPENTAHIWRQTASDSSTLERVLSATLEVESGAKLTIVDEGLLIVDSGSGIRLLKTPDTDNSLSADTLSDVSENTAYVDYELMTGDQIALRDSAGRVTKLTISDLSTRSAVRSQPWVELTQGVAHAGDLYVVDDNGTAEVLYRVDGFSAESVHTLTAGIRFERLFSVGTELYFTTRTSANALALYRLNVSDDSVAAVTLSLSDGGATVTTSSSSGSFHSFAEVNGDFVFVYSLPGANRLALIDTSESYTAATQIRDAGSGTLSQLTVVSDRIYFILGNARGSYLWTSDLTSQGTERATDPRDTSITQAANPDRLVSFKDQLYFTAPDGDATGVIWVSLPDDANPAEILTAPLVDLVDSVVPPLMVSVLDDEGDGLVNAADGSADRTTILYSAEAANEALIDVTEIVRSFLAAGKTRITFALSLNMEASAIPSDGFTIAHATDGSQLEVITGSVASVTGSLFSADGRLLQSNQSVIDLSQLQAGTYFLRVDGPTDNIQLIQRGTATIKVGGTSLGSAKDYTYYISENQLRRSNGFLGETDFLDEVVRSGPLSNEIISGADLLLIGGAGDSFYFTRVEDVGGEDTTVLWEISGVFAQRVGELTGDADQWIAVNDTLVFNVGNVLYAVEGTTLTELEDYGTATISGMESVTGRAVYKVTATDDFGRWHATDGTVAGTIALDNIQAGGQLAGDVVAAGGYLFYLEEVNGSLTLWRATPGEGQNFGAEPLKVTALAAVDAVEWSLLGVADYNVLFTVTNSAGDVQLWISNGNGDGLLGGQVGGTMMIESDLGGDASYVGVFDDRTFFVVDTAAGQQLWSTQGTADLTFVVVEELPGEARSQVVWNGETYFIAGPNLSPLLWKLTDDGAEFVSFLPVFADKLTAAGDVLAFTALFVTDTETGDALYVTDATAEGLRLVVELSPVNSGKITGIAMTENGIVFMVQNNDAIIDGFVDYSLWISNGFRDGTYPILSSNAGTLPFGTNGDNAIRPELLKVVGSVAFYAFDGRIISTDGTAAGTRILNPVQDITPVEVIASDGRLVILDEDGRLWMTEGNLVGLPYTIEVKAPVANTSHSEGDRDIINGGEGDDIIIGNGDHDILFGGGGTNFFIGESKEIRDLQSFENFTLPPIQEFSFQQPRSTDVEVWIPDVNLRAAIARALNIPVTVGFDGRPVIHGTILASRMATLIELQAPNAGIQSVVGLHFARNLKVLNLNGNRIQDLSILVPATDPVSGAITGLSNLRVFSMDYNGMGILTFTGDNDAGEGEYVDYEGLISEIQMTATFWFRTDSNDAMGLFSMDSGTRGDGGLDRSIFLDDQGRIGAFIYAGADTGYEVIRSADGTDFSDGDWHHVAYVFSSNTDVAHRLYVDGDEVAVGTVTSSSMSIQDGFNLGFAHVYEDFDADADVTKTVAGGIPNTPGTASYFVGDMDELRIWDQAFTDVLVNADMISPYPGERVTQVGYWSFDQAPGDFVIDHSLFLRNGTMGGGNVDRAPAFNRMQPDPTNRPTPGHATFSEVTSERTLFQTIIRDLGRLNVPGPLEQVSLAYNRIDVLDPLSNLPDMNYINLKGVINSEEPRLGVIIDHTDTTQPQTRLFTTKDGTVVAVDGNRTLVLSAGTWAWRRLTLGGGVDGNEHFSLTIDTNTNEVVVSAYEEEERFEIADFDQILFDGGNGNDTLSIVGNFPINLYLFGGDGDDNLSGGHADNYLFAGAGNDTMTDVGGESVLTGGRGDDTYIFYDNWGSAIVNENPNSGSDVIDFSNVMADLIINVRGTSETSDGANTVAHAANTMERFVGGQGDDIMNFHREVGGLLELGNGSLVWDRVAITHTGIERIDVRFVDDDGVRTGVVRVLSDQDYSDSDLRIEARGIDIRASIKARGLSLQATNIIGISQDFDVETGLGRLITLEADKLRIAAKNGVGDINMPIYFKAGVVEAQTEGAAGIYLVALGNAVIGDVQFDTIGSTTAGLTTTAGGNIHLVNLKGVLTVNEDIQASGGRVVITGESMDLNASIDSVREIGGQTFRGTLVLQPLSTRTSIGMATTGGQTLHFTADEINHFMNGFDSSAPATYYSGGALVKTSTISAINIGRADGRHVITLDTFNYSESFTFRAPKSFGSFDIIGTIFHSPSIVDGQNPSINFLGWR